VDLVDDHKANKIHITGVCTLAHDNVPLFRRRHNMFGDVLLCHLRITGQLADFDTISGGKTGGKVPNHLLYEGFHRGNIDYLELVERKLASLFISVFCQFVENGQC